VTDKEEKVLDNRNRKLQPFGHVCRMPEDWLLKPLMLGIVEVSIGVDPVRVRRSGPSE